MKLLLSFAICFLAPALVLALVHGPGHLTNNPSAVAMFLAGAAFGLCILAGLVSTGVKLTTGTLIARAWWPSLLSILALTMIALYLIEVTSL